MLFPSVEFALFFFIVFFISWGLKDRLNARKSFLLVASYFFYSFWDWRFVLLLFEASIVNYGLGLWLAKPLEQRRRKALLAIGITFNLVVLGFFKYWGFFISSFCDLLATIGFERELPIWEVILPMGISFFTFQGISYIVDIYRGAVKARTSLLDVLLYISFFPQLVAGPIVRAKDFIPQLEKQPDDHNIKMTYSFILIGIGLFKKVIVAHYISANVVDPIFSTPDSYNTLDILFGMYGYAVQIYCDFSAYSDMAIGLAALLGFHFNANFRQPYRAHSISDFWKRWHISLSQWLRDYLYIPLGGNRCSTTKTYRNLMLTMLLGGLWHGAAWTFVFWGGLHGMALAVTRLIREKNIHFPISHSKKVFLTFHFVCITWVFFHSATIEGAFQYLGALSNFSLPTIMINPLNVSLMFIGLYGQFIPENSIEKIAEFLEMTPILVQGSFMGLAIVIIAALGPGSMAPFIYFQF